MPTLARAVQERLERFYDLKALPPIDDFARPVNAGDREVVLVREGEDDVEMAALLPGEGLQRADAPVALDVLCQIVEGVSHFVYLAARIDAGEPTTQLELELQAEVDKFALLAFAAHRDRDAQRAMFARLYEDVRFVHEADTEHGERYRVANDLAARFCRRLGEGSPESARTRLLRFYRGGQGDKIRLARAA